MKKIPLIAAGSFIVTSLIGASTAFAAGHAQKATKPLLPLQARGHIKFDAAQMPIFGTVTAINGTTITLTTKENKIFTINAASAKIMKDRTATGAITDITIGAQIAVRGTITNTTIAATNIMIGGPKHDEKEEKHPGIGGKVTAINGSTITVAIAAHGMRGLGNAADRAATSTNYIVTTSSTTEIMKDGKPAATTDITVGSEIMVRGIVNTTAHTVAATHIGIKHARPEHSAKSEKSEKKEQHGRINPLMKKVGDLFKHKK